MKRGSKYGLLHHFMKESNSEQITLSFSKIERIIRQQLPDSAYKREWWSNRKNALQASAWIEAGYKVKELDITKKQVTFIKSTPNISIQRDQSGTVLWDGALIKALRQQMGLTQSQFAEVIGVRQQTISEWENNVYTPTRATVKHLTLIAKQAGFNMEQ